MVRIGVDLGGTKIEALALDPGGRELARRRIPTPRNDYAATVDAVGSIVEALESETGAGDPPSARVGVGTPGAVSPATGRIKNANSTWLNGRPLAEDLEERLARPIRLANDADCFALSEAVDGAGRDARTVFGVILGTGVGGGIVVDRRLLAGPNAIAGEWGHNPLPWPRDDERPGPECYCGRRGCIETFLSGPGLTRDHERGRIPAARAPASPGASRAETIAASAAAGDAGAIEALERHVDRLARSLAHVINVLDPHVIVLGGGLSNLEILYEQVPRLWGHYVFSDRVDTELMPPVHGDSGGVRGAAWLW
jgi:fructokinase